MTDKTKKNILIVAGEASGDLHGSRLVSAIKDLSPDISIQGIGGTRMEKAGVDILFTSSQMAVVGLTEVFSKLPTILKASGKLKSILKKDRPDLLILIDYPDFNIHLAATAKRCNIPVLYYISPQIWAWRSRRIKKIAKRVDRMAVILPFEKDFYQNSGLDVEYVGHPIMDSSHDNEDKDHAGIDLNTEKDTPVLGILPGSRKEEITTLLPVMIKAAEKLLPAYPDLQCILPLAPTVSADLIHSITADSPVDIKISQGNIYKALSVCDLAFVASGTATLEASIMEIPMIIMYKISQVSYWIGKKVINVPHVGLVNLVAGEEIVPELIQDDANPDTLTHNAVNILEDDKLRENMVKSLRKVKEKLGRGGASEKTAKMALDMMGKA